MSKLSALIPLVGIDRVELYINTKRKSLSAIMKETGADYGLNGGIFSGSKSLCNVKAGGKVINEPGWTEFGYAWNTGPDLNMEVIPSAHLNYLGCVPLKVPGRTIKLSYPSDMGGIRGRSAIALDGENLMLYCCADGVDAMTPEDLQRALSQFDSALMLDGGGSCQCDFQGNVIQSARVVANVILVYLKKEAKRPVSEKKTVVLDAGHDASNASNKSPDGTYYEHEFTLDMAKRMETILTRHGVAVTLTRKAGEAVSLSKRCQIANAVTGLNLFVSLHSNAADNSGWTSARGWSIFTSSAGATAGRNIAANKIIVRMKEAGVSVRGNAPTHVRYQVLTDTVAPAVLIEHGFHTNKEDVALLKSDAYRDTLAVAECKGILDYLGLDWEEEPEEETPPATASSWAAEAWEKAVSKGVFDGTSPQGAMTREMCAVVLDRLGLL